MAKVTWAYRIVKYPDDNGFGLHEVYFVDGRTVSRTTNPCSFVCNPEEGPEGVTKSLERALAAAREHPPINDEDIREPAV